MRLRSWLKRLALAWNSVLNAWRRVSDSRPKRNLRLCETLSLGDKRFLALVLVEQQKFLVGGAGNSVALLAEVPSPRRPTRDADEVHLL